jgi:hypothetical protein
VNMEGGLRYSTLNWVLKNAVPLFTSPFGLEPPRKTFLDLD